MIEKLTGCYNHPRIKEKLNEVIDVINAALEPCVVRDVEDVQKAYKSIMDAPGRRPEDLHPSLSGTIPKWKKGDPETTELVSLEPTEEERLAQLEEVCDAHFDWIRCIAFNKDGGKQAERRYLDEKKKMQGMM